MSIQPNQYAILDFDPSPKAILEPVELIAPAGIPQGAVLCFFHDVIRSLVEQGLLTQVSSLKSELGENPVYSMTYKGVDLTVVHPGLGSPLAAGYLEELIAMGCDHFIVCGGCGVLDRSIPVGHVLVPTEAVRDEGTSYAYIPPGDKCQPDPRAVNAIHAVLERRQIPCDDVLTWTTDAIYRETIDRAALRREQGCRTVEMEASAFFAVAKFRGVRLGQILYGGDSVQAEGWDSRGWVHRMSIREMMFWLAAEAVIELTHSTNTN